MDGLQGVLQGHDLLISALPAAAALELEPTIVQAASEAGGRRFMPSEYTLDVTQATVRALVAGGGAPALITGRVDWADRLAAIAAQGQIEYTTLVTSGLLDLLLASGMFGFDVAHQRAVLYDRGKAQATGCTLAFVGRCVVAVVRMPEVETQNRGIQVAEVAYTGQALLGELERATGQPWTVEHVSTDEALAQGKEALARGDGRAAYLRYIAKLNFDGSGVAHLAEGLAWNRSGAYAVSRKSLRETVAEAVSG